MAATDQTWKESPALVLRRGPYIVAAGLDRTDKAEPVLLKGRFIPLFDAAQPVVDQYAVGAGTRGLLVDLDRYPKDFVGVVAAACRVTDQKVTADAVTFDAIGQSDTNAVVSLLLPNAPKGVALNGAALPADAYDYHDGVLRMHFPNRAETVHLAVTR
jgi:hypothetical protein